MKNWMVYGAKLDLRVKCPCGADEPAQAREFPMMGVPFPMAQAPKGWGMVPGPDGGDVWACPKCVRAWKSQREEAERRFFDWVCR